MCLAVPMKIIEINENRARVSYKDIIRETSLILIENARVGDWILMHSGYAIAKIDEKEAQDTIDIFEEIERNDIK